MQCIGCGIKTGNRRLVVIRPVTQLPADATLPMKNVQNGLNRCVSQRAPGGQVIYYSLDCRWAALPKNLHQLELGFREASWFGLLCHATYDLDCSESR